MASPLLLASALIWGGRPTISMASADPQREGQCDPDPDTPTRPPVVSITIEPSVLTPYAEAEPPVVLPGYLLPDDGCEEPVHAGS